MNLLRAYLGGMFKIAFAPEEGENVLEWARRNRILPGSGPSVEDTKKGLLAAIRQGRKRGTWNKSRPFRKDFHPLQQTPFANLPLSTEQLSKLPGSAENIEKAIESITSGGHAIEEAPRIGTKISPSRLSQTMQRLKEIYTLKRLREAKGLGQGALRTGEAALAYSPLIAALGYGGYKGYKALKKDKDEEKSLPKAASEKRAEDEDENGFLSSKLYDVGTSAALPALIATGHPLLAVAGSPLLGALRGGPGNRVEPAIQHALGAGAGGLVGGLGGLGAGSLMGWYLQNRGVLGERAARNLGSAGAIGGAGLGAYVGQRMAYQALLAARQAEKERLARSLYR